MILFVIAVAAIVATVSGGLFALHFKDKLHLILGFSAGAVIGVAFFDLLPEALELGGENHSISFIMMIVAIGFAFYLVLDRVLLLHGAHEEPCQNEHHHTHEVAKASPRGLFSALSLSIHSFIDGVALGLAFNVSAAVGIIVAAAVIAHDFSDGINTVNLIVKSGGQRKQALRWLTIDAAAPVLGIILTRFITVQASSLGILLAAFAGFFLYIGASELLPESHHGHPMKWTTALTIFGMAFIFIVVHLAGI